MEETSKYSKKNNKDTLGFKRFFTLDDQKLTDEDKEFFIKNFANRSHILLLTPYITNKNKHLFMELVDKITARGSDFLDTIATNLYMKCNLDKKDIDELIINATDKIKFDSDLLKDLSITLDQDVYLKILDNYFNKDFLHVLSSDTLMDFCSSEHILKLLNNYHVEMNNYFMVKYNLTRVMNNLSDFSILEEFYKNNKEMAEKVVSNLDFSSLDERASKNLKEVLNKNKFVLKQEYLDMTDFFFFDSLKNDFNKTIKIDYKDTFYNRKLEKICSEHPETIKQLIIENLSNSKVYPSECLTKLISFCPGSLTGALQLGYENTLKNLRNSSYRIRINNTDFENIFKLLEKKDFNLKDYKDYGLEKLNLIFPIVSLKNHYQDTKEVLLNDAKIDIPMSNALYFYIKKMIIANNDEELLNYFTFSNGDFFTRELLINPDKVLKKIKNYNLNFEFTRDNAVSVLNYLSKNNIDYKGLGELAGKLASVVFTIGNEKTYKQCLNEALNSKFPKSLIPFSNIYQLLPYLNNDKERELYQRVYKINYQFNYDDAKELLKLLHTPSKTIEEELRRLNDQNLNRADLSLMQMLLIYMYGKKNQKLKNVSEYPLHLFKYSLSKNLLGDKSDRDINIYNGNNLSVYDFITLLNHEITHAKQSYDILKLDNDDIDVCSYSKDIILRKLLSGIGTDTYYDDNYNFISYEFDTDLKAHIETLKVLKEDENYNYDNMTIEDLYQYSKDKSHYFQTFKRKYNNKYYDLDELFLTQVNKSLKLKDITLNEIFNLAPIIQYEFNVKDNQLVKKSITELFDQYNKGSDKDKSIYLSIIKNRLDLYYNAKNAIEDKEELRSLNSEYAELNNEQVDNFLRCKRLDYRYRKKLDNDKLKLYLEYLNDKESIMLSTYKINNIVKSIKAKKNKDLNKSNPKL